MAQPDPLQELLRLRAAARDAATQFGALGNKAHEEGRNEDAQQYERARQKAIVKETELNRKIQAGIINPAGAGAVSLKAKTDQLEARIEKMRQGIARLQDATKFLSILTDAVSIALLL